MNHQEVGKIFPNAVFRNRCGCTARLLSGDLELVRLRGFCFECEIGVAAKLVCSSVRLYKVAVVQPHRRTRATQKEKIKKRLDITDDGWACQVGLVGASGFGNDVVVILWCVLVRSWAGDACVL